MWIQVSLDQFTRNIPVMRVTCRLGEGRCFYFISFFALNCLNHLYGFILKKWIHFWVFRVNILHLVFSRFLVSSKHLCTPNTHRALLQEHISVFQGLKSPEVRKTASILIQHGPEIFDEGPCLSAEYFWTSQGILLCSFLDYGKTELEASCTKSNHFVWAPWLGAPVFRLSSSVWVLEDNS